MKILFICDYFPPFVKGGGEISSYWQVKKLIQKGIKVIVLAPKYKNRLKIKKEDFKIYWYSIPLKTESVSPIIFLNPFFFIYLLYNFLKVVRKEKPDLIHCQGKYSLPSIILTRVVLKIPVILTLRDYQGICNHGFCLWQGKKKCNFLSFFKKDFFFYYQNYIKKKNFFTFLLQLIASYMGRINAFILAFFMKKSDKFVCVSHYVADVYVNNGYDRKKMVTIYNLTPEIKIKGVKVPEEIIQKINEFKYVVLYAGKVSLGKGASLLIDVARGIVKEKSDVLFIFCGKIHYPVKKIKSDQLLFLGGIDYQLLIKIINLVDLVCVPSIWPEPLSRVTLEAFSLAKPVLSSNVGGQKELVSSKTGWLFKPTRKDLMVKLSRSLKSKEQLRILGQNGKRKMMRIEKEQINKLISLYRSRLT